jgi:cellulose synthase/poly-beta-1,6-N-acetylglucosamine synthase-like glycosyltransferase
VSYVPTAALLVRRSALLAVSERDDPFDEQMRVGEDVDFIWRLHSAGWRIRYVPAVQVAHQEPRTWSGLLHRRFVYGTSAAPLAQRHPEAMAPLALHPWPTLAVAALLARSPVLAAAAFTGSVLSMRRNLTREKIPPNGVLPAMATAAHQTWLGIGRYTTQFAAPLLIAALVKPGGRSRRRRWGRRLAWASLLLGPPVTTWRQRRPNLDPARFVLGQLADDVSYGAGVWTGAIRARTTLPLRPSIVWHPLRIDSPGRKS